jgi:hypothetical protein
MRLVALKLALGHDRISVFSARPGWIISTQPVGYAYFF